MGFFAKLLNRPGTEVTRRMDRHRAQLPVIEKLGEEIAGLGDEELTAAAGEVFTGYDGREAIYRFAALAREAGERTLGERAYDTQVLGLIGLLEGHVVEMATGEGKTLIGAMAAAGYALQGRTVHVLSVNDYLADRDHDWMRPLLQLLGVESGSVTSALDREARQAAYAKEIVYGAVTEIGFDVLRDRFITEDEEQRIGARDVVIVDEADSILIDEARVPLVLAGSTEVEEADAAIAALVESMHEGEHYEVSEDRRAVSLTPAGTDLVESRLEVELYGEDAQTLAAVNLALYAKALVTKDVDYLVVDGEVKLISESRGRVANLQRWPDGLQAAVEAKERLATSVSGEILDQITVEELIMGYSTICGMTGTAVAVGDDLREFYELEIARIEPHLPVQRVDEPDRLYTLQSSKEKAIIEEVVEQHRSGRPILIGTRSVAESESLAEKLAARGIEPQVLNAKDDSREAEIIARAGQRGAVTVSTQMAGRGTDIRLGGEDVVEAGGLLVIGAGRYPSSRLDDQLRGRAGRQGDPGTSVFFTSLEDDLMTRVPEAQRFVTEGDEHGRIDNRRAAALVEHAQRIAEGENTAVHRDTWRFTQLMAKQRELVLQRRAGIRAGEDGITEVREGLGADRVKEIEETIGEDGANVLDETIRQTLLFQLDSRWVEHLAFLNDLREGIHLRTLARERPHEAFNTESIAAFNSFWPDVLDASVEALREAEFTSEGVDLPTLGMKRPSSTWTYLTTESAFGSDIETIVKKIRG
ncbi:accessory Sec system translocase SecA2 [Sediminivirga luteola]|uniref:Protein translocase subunit SecA n=1 Tax=Sediminivirga luteola TaxID=1774748 RepID=A0A8J2U015_9MICO|nr:accessory Sec system translocase SecA2 [Sediminivirga luteola]MCI2264052.1 accessory Sec system translocase SecA2 [Sediminivirga luteola]GGA22737.1 protein translocase subunit SecA [Sediminivirga luteola]